MKKLSIVSVCLLVFAALAVFATNAYAFQGFDDDGGAGLPPCSICHADIANNGPDHGTHAGLSNNDCGSCHDGSISGGFNNPPLDNCVRCHGRDEDAGGDSISAGLGRGLRRHHETVGAASCGICHLDASGPIGVGEDVLPSFYPLALGGAGLDPCDGSEENFPSNSVSLDNDGDGLTDGADPDCAEPECLADADCDDLLFCTGVETCVDGVCVAGTPVECDDGVACTEDICDEDADACVYTPNDSLCDDSDICTGQETCDPVNGCQPGTPLDCDDGDFCTNDGCGAMVGCVYTPVECPAGEVCDPGDGICKPSADCTVDADCDDLLYCTGVETCVDGTCVAGTPVDCDDGFDCTEDICDEDADACVNIPDDTACDDSMYCNGIEACVDGVCIDGTPIDCDDGVDCTIDSCDEVNDQCVNEPDDTACPDDGLFCTGDEICDPAAGCVSAGDPCPDGSTCNEDTDMCDMVMGKVTICHIPPGNPAKARTLSIEAYSVDDHLAHGDLLGPCP